MLRKTFTLMAICGAILLFSCNEKKSFTVKEGQYETNKEYADFALTTKVKMAEGASGAIAFHTDGSGKGYEVQLLNGAVDGTRKTGSLNSVRNLYKSSVNDNEWFTLDIIVAGESIIVDVNGITVVSYTEPKKPYRNVANSNMLLGSGDVVFKSYEGAIEFEDMIIDRNPSIKNKHIFSAIDEENDQVIRFQQENFPLIDHHVHMKGLTSEEAYLKSMEYGINYSIVPNCGIGFQFVNDRQVAGFFDSMKNIPTLIGMQGEGREWPTTFSLDTRNRFDYVFTDALTYIDHYGRRVNLWIDETVVLDVKPELIKNPEIRIKSGMTPKEMYMEQIVGQIVTIVGSEPIDLYANSCYLPSALLDDYDKLWTDERIARVINVVKEAGVGMEINARFKIPNFKTIKAAKEAGIKFTFGTNNETAEDMDSKLGYCIEAIRECGLTVDDLWFSSMKKTH